MVGQLAFQSEGFNNQLNFFTVMVTIETDY